MHWSEELAERIIQKNPDKEEYVCAAGVSPSGSVHIGNFRDIATSLFVVKALEKKGKKARLLISWDEFDRCRKIPANVQAVVGLQDFPGFLFKFFNPFLCNNIGISINKIRFREFCHNVTSALPDVFPLANDHSTFIRMVVPFISTSVLLTFTLVSHRLIASIVSRIIFAFATFIG